MPENEREEEVLTRLLNRARSGDAQAEAEILPRVYRELRAIAAHKMRGAGGHTLQPTALVHEAYLRLQGGLASLENRKHFFFAAARAMRDILVEHARQKQSLKRGGDQVHVSTDNLVEPIAVPAEDLLGLDAALERLEQVSPRGFQLVMLRFFAGLSKEQAAETLGISERTGDRDWRTAKAFLRSH
ncbi:MAG: ECF-type sigma factor, partial [Myxococcota bacterium]